MTQEAHVTRFKAIGPNASVHVICERRSAGEIATCPKCGADLMVALTWKDAREYDSHPGVFCPKDSKHFQILLNVVDRKKD